MGVFQGRLELTSWRRLAKMQDGQAWETNLSRRPKLLETWYAGP